MIASIILMTMSPNPRSTINAKKTLRKLPTNGTRDASPSNLILLGVAVGSAVGVAVDTGEFAFTNVMPPSDKKQENRQQKLQQNMNQRKGTIRVFRSGGKAEP